MRDVVHHSPLAPSATFSRIAGAPIYLKLENLQKTGSFKIRGAANRLRTLPPEVLARGVVAASAGNHAQGVAYAAGMIGVQSTIVMPRWAPISKVTATRNYGAQVILHGTSYDDAQALAAELATEKGLTFVHAFNDPQVVAGQGTAGLEILDDLPEVETVVAPIGGGGLISGLALALKESRPGLRLIGVQAAGAPSFYRSRRLGERTALEDASTIADGIAVKTPGELTYPLIERYVDDIVLVSDEEIARAILLLLERAKQTVEGAGAVSLAALLSRPGLARGPTAALISGGNIDVNILSRIIERGLVQAGRYVRLATEISDRPGALASILQVVAATQGNVLSIRHERLDPAIGLGRVRVELALETRDPEHIREIVGRLEELGHDVRILQGASSGGAMRER